MKNKLLLNLLTLVFTLINTIQLFAQGCEYNKSNNTYNCIPCVRGTHTDANSIGNGSYVNCDGASPHNGIGNNQLNQSIVF